MFFFLATSPSQYNELHLSPNLYTVVPVVQVCQFANLYMLNMSYNQLTNMTGIFAKLSCLTQLTHLELSHNAIATPILATDFDDSLPAHLLWLNLAYNNIPSIESATFFLADGSARFPNMAYLSLANNRLVTIDLLWPMTMSNANLIVEFNNNLISNLVNPLGFNFGKNTFIPMTGNRYVNLK